MSTVVVSGTDEPLGQLLAARLGEHAAVSDCHCVSTTEAATGAAVLVYLAGGRGRDGLPDVDDARRLLGGAARAGARRLVVISSAAVHEPSNHHPGYVDEDRVAKQRTSNPVPRRWRELEDTAREAIAGRSTKLVVLRPPAVLVAGGQDFWSRFFSRRVKLLPPGFDPTLQLLSAGDLARAVARAIASEAAGTYHLAPSAAVPLRRAARAAGGLRLPLPLWLQRLLGRGTAGQLRYLCHATTVSAERIGDELGVTPTHSSLDALRRLRGEPAADGEEPPDPFGLDRSYWDRLAKTLFRFLHDGWWRVEHRGLEHLPKEGGAVLAGVHRGFMPWDGVMTVHLIARELGRYARFLIHPTLVKFPFLAPYMLRMGGVHASHENADWVLDRGDLLAVYPEGIRGAFRRYREAYTLGKFGRDEYVRMALRHGVPIVPFVTVGSAEIFPILAKIRWAWFSRFSEWPAFPITPTMGTVPLPSKWHTRFLEPIPTAHHGPEAAADRQVVRALSAEVRGRMEAAIAEMLARRRSIFWGSVFADDGSLKEEQAMRGST